MTLWDAEKDMANSFRLFTMLLMEDISAPVDVVQ